MKETDLLSGPQALPPHLLSILLSLSQIQKASFWFSIPNGIPSKNRTDFNLKNNRLAIQFRLPRPKDVHGRLFVPHQNSPTPAPALRVSNPRLLTARGHRNHPRRTGDRDRHHAINGIHPLPFGMPMRSHYAPMTVVTGQRRQGCTRTMSARHHSAHHAEQPQARCVIDGACHRLEGRQQTTAVARGAE